MQVRIYTHVQVRRCIYTEACINAAFTYQPTHAGVSCQKNTKAKNGKHNSMCCPCACTAGSPFAFLHVVTFWELVFVRTFPKLRHYLAWKMRGVEAPQSDRMRIM